MKKARHSHIALLIFAVAVTSVVMAAYAYLHHAVTTAATEASAARDLAAAAQSDKSQQQGIVALYQSTAADRARLASLYIPADQPVDFIESIESLGNLAGSAVELSSISADALDGAAPGTVGDAQVHVNATGPWSAVMKTLLLAENLTYKTHIASIQLDGVSSVPGAKSASQWKLSFDLHTYVIATVVSTSTSAAHASTTATH